jgi:NADH:ubiquinone oxidoreductase subunit 3 (subunit A)
MAARTSPTLLVSRLPEFKLTGIVANTVQDKPYLFLVVFIVAGTIFSLTPLAIAWLWAKKFSPKKSGPSKNAVYECGLESDAKSWVQFKSDYYLYAIIFLVFDVETIFLLPFAVAFKTLSVGAFLSIVVFLLLLAEGLVWAWRKGVLSWK